MPKYSIIIPTFNRAGQLKRCLNAVSHQSIPASEYEIIVVDDGSTDNTKEIVSQFIADSPSLTIQYLNQKNQGCGSARNFGIKNAKGEILFFTDDDCIVPKNWMEEILKGFEKHPDAAGVGGWYSFNTAELQNNPLARAFYLAEKSAYLNYEEYTAFGNTLGNPAGNTANMAYRKKIFEAIGFFDTYTKKTARIDTEFKNRVIYAGFPLLYIPLIIHHAKKMTKREFIAKAFRYGIADYYLSKRFIGIDNIISFLSPDRNAKNFFFLISRVKNYSPISPIRYYAILLFFRWIGAKYAAIKRIYSVTTFTPSVVPRNDLKEYQNKQFQYNCRYDRQDYLYGKAFVEARARAHDYLNTKSSRQTMATVIIPFYNRSTYITSNFIRQINNLQADSSAVEIILIDDGSTDNTLDALREAAKVIRFKTRVITQKNSGPAAARNTGIRQSKGEFIFFMDSDVLPPFYWLSELLAPFFLDERIALTGSEQINPKPRTYFDNWRNSRASRQSFTITNQLGTPPFDTATLCVKKSALEEAGLLFFDESFKILGYEDYDYTVRIKNAGKLAAFVPQFVINTRSLDLESFAQMCIARASGYKILKKKYAAHWRGYPMIFDFIQMDENRHQIIGSILQILFLSNRRRNFIDFMFRASVFNGEKHPWLLQFLILIASSGNKTPKDYLKQN